MRGLSLLLLGLLLVLGGGATAKSAGGQRLATVFEEANTASARGDFPRAIEGYQRLLEAGVEDPDVHFNLATTHARAGQYGRAILHFERTLLLRPGDAEATRGVRAVEDLLAKRHGGGTAAGAHRGAALLDTLARPFPPEVLALAILGLNVLLFGLLAARRFTQEGNGRTALGAGATAAAVLLVSAALLLAVREGTFREGAPGVVLQEAVLREAPDPRAGARGDAIEGERVRVLERHGRYLRVTTLAGAQGWMTSEEVGEVRLDAMAR
jgi:tetratricopeptide (TPR) repeat protein